ncbi:hypothetical protein J502_2963 [Acinetobacter sp. 1294596]|uniref:hypothetical protein n=1 Tax=Acinetobacter sp. 1294596 TaxID=1310603 RepID=UPI00044623E8|nr:hypothetical protein [Acinetobacter sp. 1294596]EXF55956.1 hypothetical protein J502_2963 [Acinetobacter sp. 1294596]
MAFICEELSSDLTSPQTCTKWIVLENSNHSFMPELTTQEKDELLLWFIAIFVVVFTVKMIRKLMGI